MASLVIRKYYYETWLLLPNLSSMYNDTWKGQRLNDPKHSKTKESTSAYVVSQGSDSPGQFVLLMQKPGLRDIEVRSSSKVVLSVVFINTCAYV